MYHKDILGPIFDVFNQLKKEIINEVWVLKNSLPSSGLKYFLKISINFEF